LGNQSLSISESNHFISGICGKKYARKANCSCSSKELPISEKHGF